MSKGGAVSVVHRRRLATGLAVVALLCVMPSAAATTSIAAAGTSPMHRAVPATTG